MAQMFLSVLPDSDPEVMGVVAPKGLTVEEIGVVYPGVGVGGVVGVYGAGVKPLL